MEDSLDSYTEQDFDAAFWDLVRKLVVGCTPVEDGHPVAYLLGGQSGAGKTALHVILKELHCNNVVVINGDTFRKFHPHFRELEQRYGKESVDHTAAWAGKMTETLVDYFSSLSYNLVIEGTLRTSEVPLASATLLRERGYDVSLALMAVKPEISLVSCQLRYEQMRIAGTTPRATDPAHHRKIVDQIVSNLAVLEESGMFDGIYLYNRDRVRLYPQDGLDLPASQVLEDVLFGNWTEAELAHYRALKSELEELQRKG